MFFNVMVSNHGIMVNYEPSPMTDSWYTVNIFVNWSIMNKTMKNHNDTKLLKIVTIKKGNTIKNSFAEPLWTINIIPLTILTIYDNHQQ